MTLYANDCIFFSKVICDDLERYSARLRRKHFWRGRFGLPKTGKIDWSLATTTGLIPENIEYCNWLKGFRSKQSLLKRVTSSNPFSRD
jgi:hypothetical protein